MVIFGSKNNVYFGPTNIPVDLVTGGTLKTHHFSDGHVSSLILKHMRSPESRFDKVSVTFSIREEGGL